MTTTPRLTYPTAPTADQVDDYHGHRIADPYRPLEDADAPATRTWIAEQNALTDQVLAAAPAARRDPRPARRAVELPAGRRPVAARRPLVPAPQHRPPGPGRAVDGERAGRGGDRGPRPEPARPRRHDHAVVGRRLGERRARRVRDQRRGLRLADVDGAAGRDGRGAPGPDPVGEVRRGGLDRRRRRLLLRPLPAAARRRGVRRAEPRHGAALPPDRDAVRRRSPGLRDARGARVDLRARGARRRPAAGHLGLPGHGPREPGVRRGPHGRRRGGGRAPRDRRGGRALRPDRDRRWPAVPRDRPGRPARTGDRGGRASTRAPSRRSSRRARTRWSSSRSSATASRPCTSTTRTTGSRCSSSTGGTAGEVALPGLGMVAGLAGRRVDDDPLPDVHDVPRAARGPGGRHGGRVRAHRGVASAAVGPGRLRQRAGLRHLRRRDAGPAVPQPAPGRRARRQRPDAALRLRRVPDPHRPDVQARVARLDGARRPARGRVPAGRVRVRQGLARRGPSREQAERVRRLRRLCPLAGRHRGGRGRSGSASAGARTAACWSGRASRSTRSCSAPRSRRSA